MMTLYAKNMMGDITSLIVPVSNHQNILGRLDLVTYELARIVSPENPSRVRLLSYQDPYQEEKEYDFCKPMDEMDTSLNRTWLDGGILTYFLEERLLSVRMYSWDSPIYSMNDYTRRCPFFCMEFWIYPPEDKTDIIYCYKFAIRFKTGKLVRITDCDILEDDGDSFIDFTEPPIWTDDIYTLLRNDLSIPFHYRHLILRASYRKWSRLLREKSRLTLIERHLQVKHKTCHVYKEREFFKKLYEDCRRAGSPFGSLFLSSSLPLE